MNLQIHNTNLPHEEFFTKDFGFPFHEERVFVDNTDGKGVGLSSDIGLGIFLWRKIENLHINGQEPILFDSLKDTVDETIEANLAESSTDRIETFVAERFLAIPSVEYVFLLSEGNSLDVWTVINNLDRDGRQKIYDVEYDILGFLPTFDFDFHVVCRNDRNIEDIRPSNVKMIFSK